MIKNITLGQYFPGDSIIHRLDPRTKLLLAIAMIVAIFSGRYMARLRGDVRVFWC